MTLLLTNDIDYDYTEEFFESVIYIRVPLLILTYLVGDCDDINISSREFFVSFLRFIQVCTIVILTVLVID